MGHPSYLAAIPHRTSSDEMWRYRIIVGASITAVRSNSASSSEVPRDPIVNSLFTKDGTANRMSDVLAFLS